MLALEDERIFIQEIEDESPVRPLRESRKLERFLESYVSPDVDEEE